MEDNVYELLQKWKLVHIVLVCTSLTDQFMHLKHPQNGADHTFAKRFVNLYKPFI